MNLVNSLICLRKQRQNTSCSYAVYFDTEKVLTKWSSIIIFCVCVKSSSNFWAFQTGPWNVAQWTQASQKIQVRKGRDFGFLTVLIDSLQWTNVAKTAHRKNVTGLKKYRKQCIHLFLCKPYYRNCKASCWLSTSNTYETGFITDILQIETLRLPPTLRD